jgi:hypothetical protein
MQIKLQPREVFSLAGFLKIPLATIVFQFHDCDGSGLEQG